MPLDSILDSLERLKKVFESFIVQDSYRPILIRYEGFLLPFEIPCMIPGQQLVGAPI